MRRAPTSERLQCISSLANQGANTYEMIPRRCCYNTKTLKNNPPTQDEPYRQTLVTIRALQKCLLLVSEDENKFMQLHDTWWKLLKLLWNLMKPYKAWWNCLKLYETLCNFMELYTKLHETVWNCMERDETLWNLMILHEASFNFLKRYEASCYFMERYETLRNFMQL